MCTRCCQESLQVDMLRPMGWARCSHTRVYVHMHVQDPVCTCVPRHV